MRATERDSKEKLIEVAKAVFARKGFNGATVKELADEAGVNVSLVSYYFGGKEGLYHACLEQVGRSRLNLAQRILTPPQSLEDFKVRLRLFVEEQMIFHLEQKDVCAILQRECDSDTPAIRDIFRDTFLRVYETLRDYFESAQAAKIIHSEADIEIMSFLFFSSMMNVTRFDHLSKEYYGHTIEDPRWREQVVSHAVGWLVDGFLNPPGPNQSVKRPRAPR